MLSMAALFLALVAADPAFESEMIFPPDPKHNHSSCIVQTPAGDLLTCWFHGTGERQSDDVLVQGARKRAGAAGWCEPFVMADTPDLPDCNPVLFIDPRQTLWLFWVAIQDNHWGGALLKCRTTADYSDDGPPRWQWQEVIHCRPQNLETIWLENVKKAEEKYALLLMGKLKQEIEETKEAAKDKLSQRLGWMTRLHPIMLDAETMMLGLYSDVFNCSLAAFTKDFGKTWQFSQPIIGVDLGNIQPAFVKKRDGGIVAYMRDNGLPHRIRTASSTDNGMTWSDVTPTEIVNPGSSVDCIALASGNWVMLCNDVKGRHVLTAYLSDDEGATWKWKRPVENFEPGAGSASYPSLLQTNDGVIHCTYSFTSKDFKGSTIKHTWFNEEWLKAE